MPAKEQLRRCIETFKEEETLAALRLLELRADPVIVAFRNAPVDDEPFEADEAALAEARADFAAGRTMTRCQSSSGCDALARRANSHRLT